MANQFGAQVSDQSAYDTARAALRDMTNLDNVDNGNLGPNQAKALADERAARAGR